MEDDGVASERAMDDAFFESEDGSGVDAANAAVDDMDVSGVILGKEWPFHDEEAVNAGVPGDDLSASVGWAGERYAR